MIIAKSILKKFPRRQRVAYRYQGTHGVQFGTVINYNQLDGVTYVMVLLDGSEKGRTACLPSELKRLRSKTAETLMPKDDLLRSYKEAFFTAMDKTRAHILSGDKVHSKSGREASDWIEWRDLLGAEIERRMV